MLFVIVLAVSLLANTAPTRENGDFTYNGFRSANLSLDGLAALSSHGLLKLTNWTKQKSEIVDPAVRGTLNILRACAKVPSIKRVVITSSMAAVVYTGRPLNSSVVLDETWFSNLAICEESKLWYPLSKTLAEKAAWEFTKENGIDLVVINPGHVIGPLLQPTVNLSAEIIPNLINGVQLPFECFAFVDVRDVALVHILALENPSASGRYCLVGETLHHHDVLRLLRKLYPTLHLPERCDDDGPPVSAYRVSREKVEGLGAAFTPLEVSVRDNIESLMKKGFPLV
ncbi:hypothetical protein BT93_C1674 [Corymbia citriodora subsp. variegata]|nr:hypothetical protein BT93_C1674 [Corymbia citriodora subsp. variegata]